MKVLRCVVIVSFFNVAYGQAFADNPPVPPLVDTDSLTSNIITTKYIIDATPTSSVAAGQNNPRGAYSGKVAKITLPGGGSSLSATITPTAERFPNAIYKWYGFSFYLPAADWAEVTTPIRVAQMDSSDSSLPPPFAIRVNGEQLEVELNANSKVPGSSAPPTYENRQTRIFALGPAPRNTWHCIVIRAKWSSVDLMGDFRLWNSSSAEISYQAVNTHNTYVGVTPVPRVGIELTGAPAAGSPDRSIIVGPIIHGQENTYAQAFLDAMPCRTQ